MLIGAAIKINLQEAANGRPQFEIDNPLLWTKALDQSGILWFGGLFIHQMHRSSLVNRDYTFQDLYEDQTGPMIDTALTAGNLIVKGASDFTDDWEFNDEATNRAALKFWLQNMPFQNMWWWTLANVKIFEKTFNDRLLDQSDPLREVRRNMRWALEGR